MWPPVSALPAVNFPAVSMTPVDNLLPASMAPKMGHFDLLIVFANFLKNTRIIW
jgi:hypothetical protein